MRKESLLKGMARIALSFVLLWSCMFSGAQLVHAKRVAGELSGRTFPANIFYSPQATSWQVDQAGTIWNNVDDVEKRKFIRHELPGYAAARTVPALGASSTYVLAVPTGSVSSDRHTVSIYNPKSNTQQFHVNFASMTLGGTGGQVVYPATATWTVTLAPGDRYEEKLSSSCHPVIMSTGTIATETAQVREFTN